MLKASRYIWEPTSIQAAATSLFHFSRTECLSTTNSTRTRRANRLSNALSDFLTTNLSNQFANGSDKMSNSMNAMRVVRGISQCLWRERGPDAVASRVLSGSRATPSKIKPAPPQRTEYPGVLNQLDRLRQDFSTQYVEPGQGISNCEALFSGIMTRVDFVKAAVYRGLCCVDALRDF